MEKKNIFIGILGFIIILLLGSCIYLWKQTEKPDLNVYIGTTIDESTVQFGDFIDDKTTSNNIMLGLINATSIDEPNIVKNLPDANIRIDDIKKGVCYLWIKVWVDGDDVIFSIGDDDPQYKKTNGDWGKTFIEYISKYK